MGNKSLVKDGVVFQEVSCRNGSGWVIRRDVPTHQVPTKGVREKGVGRERGGEEGGKHGGSGRRREEAARGRRG